MQLWAWPKTSLAMASAQGPRLGRLPASQTHGLGPPVHSLPHPHVGWRLRPQAWLRFRGSRPCPSPVTRPGWGLSDPLQRPARTCILRVHLAATGLGLDSTDAWSLGQSPPGVFLPRFYRGSGSWEHVQAFPRPALTVSCRSLGCCGVGNAKARGRRELVQGAQQVHGRAGT